MKLIGTLILFLVLKPILGQENLIPNPGFENKHNEAMIFDETNPQIPCRRGEVEEGFVPDWTSFGHINLDNNFYGPTIFDSRYDCGLTMCSAYLCDQTYGGEERVGIPENFYENNPGNSDLVSQYHRQNIDWQTGGNELIFV